MEPREIRIGHSPDPDDAFMFYALTHGKLDTAGLTFKHVIRDIESLNHLAWRANWKSRRSACTRMGT
jgi:1,4-dihydroxy-6-naphthoate synthase